MAGAPFGNQNARKAKQWEQAINRALERRGNGDRSKALDELADKFLQCVDEGFKDHMPGFGALGDRLDGKPAQALEHSGPDGEALPTLVNVTLTKPDNA